MDTGIIRQKLHNYLEIADDKKVKAIYAIMEDDIVENEIIYSAELEKELDSRYKNYRNKNTGIFTAEQSKKRISSLLSSKRK